MSLADAMEAIPEVDRGGAPLCERALVGALLIDSGMRGYVNHVTPAEFANVALGRLFGMIMEMSRVDLVLAVDEAERRGMAKLTGLTGLGVYLASLQDMVPDVENVAEYGNRVKRAAVARTVAAGLEKMRMERAMRAAS